MNNQLAKYIELCLNGELKWMYHYDVSDAAFGVETDKYQWCKQVLNGTSTVEEMIEYFETNYLNDETKFIETLKELNS